MSEEICDRTDALLAAALTRAGAEAGAETAAGSPALPEELEAHLLACAACSDALLVGQLLARDAAALDAAVGPPPAETVWRRARARLDAEALERATRPITVVRRVAWAAGAAAGLGAAWRLAPAAGGWLERLRRLEWPGGGWRWELPSAAGLEGDGMLFAAAAAVLLALLYGVYSVWAEEG
jgi:hypothetical protein